MQRIAQTSALCTRRGYGDACRMAITYPDLVHPAQQAVARQEHNAARRPDAQILKPLTNNHAIPISGGHKATTRRNHLDFPAGEAIEGRRSYGLKEP
ncbi:hypothetical protein FIE12Z_6281 [Fusarium flagelliforme]|uniref:Uncharacterized protein n=1 Tax=Fusarium flagelliforme TaxID=2675880 RepID=A0A395MNG6_9HYPO|nr:hypothetical protein FIE12Z_6281 [Fusarium flagelliforme]